MATISGTLSFDQPTETGAPLTEKSYVFKEDECDFNKIALWRYRHGRVVMFSQLNNHSASRQLSLILGVLQDETEKFNRCVYIGVNHNHVDVLVNKLERLTDNCYQSTIRISPTIVRNIQASLLTFDQENRAYNHIKSMVDYYSIHGFPSGNFEVLLNRVQNFSEMGFSSSFYIMGESLLKARFLELAKLCFERMSDQADPNYQRAKFELAMLCLATKTNHQKTLNNLNQCVQLPEAKRLIKRVKHISEGGNGFPEIK